MSATGADAAPDLPLGRILITQGARAALSDNDIYQALLRQRSYDWGELDAEDKNKNDVALLVGERIVSVYRSVRNDHFYIITERDCSYTTILLPDEY